MTAALFGLALSEGENEEENAVEDQVESDHHAVADQNLKKTIAEMIAERIKIPAQKTARKGAACTRHRRCRRSG
jgi:hypothetical protein